MGRAIPHFTRLGAGKDGQGQTYQSRSAEITIHWVHKTSSADSSASVFNSPKSAAQASSSGSTISTAGCGCAAVALAEAPACAVFPGSERFCRKRPAVKSPAAKTAEAANLYGVKDGVKDAKAEEPPRLVLLSDFGTARESADGTIPLMRASDSIRAQSSSEGRSLSASLNIRLMFFNARLLLQVFLDAIPRARQPGLQRAFRQAEGYRQLLERNALAFLQPQ